MMNLDLIPPIPAMNTAAVQFLDLLADPNAARKLMDDLVEAHAKASAAHDEATRLRVEVIGKQHQLDQDKRDFEQHRTAHSAFLLQSGSELDARHAAADSRERKLSEASAAHDAREAKIATHESALQARENDLVIKERELAGAKTAHDAQVHRINRALEHFQKAVAILTE